MAKKKRITNRDIKLIDKNKGKVEMIECGNQNFKLLEDENQKSIEKIASLQNEIKETKDNFLRKIADYENSRKLIKKETEMAIENANTRFMKEVIVCVDNFDRAIDAAERTDSKDNIVNGLKMIDKQFHQMFERFGVTQFDSKGEKFNPEKHEAISTVSDKKQEDGIIVDEHQKGYLFQGKLIRPSRVVVNKIESENSLENND